MRKKYFIEFSFEDSLNGVMELTDEEFETVRRVTNPLNWEEPVEDWRSYRCGDFRIVPLEEHERELASYRVAHAITK